MPKIKYIFKNKFIQFTCGSTRLDMKMSQKLNTTFIQMRYCIDNLC